MEQHALIRLVARIVTQVLTTALTCVWFSGIHGWLAVILATIASAVAGEAVSRALNDERIDRSLSTVRGWFTSVKKAVQ